MKQSKFQAHILFLVRLSYCLMACSIIDVTDSVILYCIIRVHLALYTEKAASESTGCYSRLHVSCYIVGWSYFAAKWCWFITFFHSCKIRRKAGGSSPGKKLGASLKTKINVSHVQFTGKFCYLWALAFCNVYYIVLLELCSLFAHKSCASIIHLLFKHMQTSTSHYSY